MCTRLPDVCTSVHYEDAMGKAVKLSMTFLNIFSIPFVSETNECMKFSRKKADNMLSDNIMLSVDNVYVI
jgi:hypothetical protein